MVAVTLAVAALTAVGFFSDRLQSGLHRDARQLLGGDAVVVTDNPPAAEWLDQAKAMGLQSTLTQIFPTMGRAPEEQGGATRLVALKVVGPGYPLRGSLRLTKTPQDTQGSATREIPAHGEVWVEQPLLEALGLRIGDALLLGDGSLRITHLISFEPDRGSGFMSFAPRVMINEADLPATNLVQPASRITYRLAVAGDGAAVQRYQTWAEAQLKKPETHGVRLETLESGRPEMRQTLDRAEKFLNLVALLSALLSSVAVALAARGFAARHLDDCAMLRVLGLPQRAIAGAYAIEFLLVGLFASGVGVALGFGVHYLFVAMLSGLVDSALPAASLWPVAFGLGIGLTLLAAFGLPPVLQLAQVPPLRVIRRDVGALRPASLAVLGLGVAGFAALLLAVSSDLTLGLIAVGGFVVAVGVFALLSWVAVKLLRRVVNESTAPRWLVLATRQISARPAYAMVQVSSLAVGLLALVLLRTDLVSSWRQATPPDAPNRFVINIMPEQGDGFRAALKGAGVDKLDWYPMFRGRLIAINGKEVSPDSYTDERAKRMVDREFNLSNALEKPPHNEVTAGRWTEGEAGALSVEDGIAETLGLKMGDSLRFDIAGVPVEAKVTSLRKVDWASMRANFFVMFPLAQMPDVPATYLAAFRAPQKAGFDNQLVRQFPNITNVDMSATPLEDVELDGVELAAGTKVVFLKRPDMLEDRHFANAKAYDPDRWLRGRAADAGAHEPRAYLQFGAGARVCPGRHLAGVEIRLVLSMLMRNFRVTLAVDPVTIREVMAFTMTPDRMPVRLTAR